MRRMTTVVAMVAGSRFDSVHVVTKDSVVTGAQYIYIYIYSCTSIVLVFLGCVCSAVAIGGGRPLSSFDELLSMAVLTTCWWMLLMADL